MLDCSLALLFFAVISSVSLHWYSSVSILRDVSAVFLEPTEYKGFWAGWLVEVENHSPDSLPSFV